LGLFCPIAGFYPIFFSVQVQEAGGSVELQEYSGAIHDWQFFAYLPEAEKAVKDIGVFINAKLGN
jgi:acetyl esterase/lipase